MPVSGRIAIKRKDGSYLSSFHYNDSDPEYLGKLLIDKWDNDDVLIEQAISIGDSIKWDESIKENAYYENTPTSRPMISWNIQELLDEGTADWEQYVYVRENGTWSMFEGRKKYNLASYLEKQNI